MEVREKAKRPETERRPVASGTAAEGVRACVCVCVMGFGLVYRLRCAWASVRDAGRVPAVVTHLRLSV